MAVQLFLERLEPVTQPLLVFGPYGALTLDLPGAKNVEGLLQGRGPPRDLLGGLVEVELAREGTLHFIICRITDQRVAGADIKVDIGQRFDPEIDLGCVRLHLRGELEEEAELTDLDGLFHDIDAKEVVKNDVLED